MRNISIILVITFLCISLFADINADLIQAAKDGDLDKVKQLIEQGADVNAKCIALMFAAWNGNTEVAKLLIQAGADVNAKNNNGHTALWCAIARGHTVVVQLLLEAGAEE